ncbi:MAG TPA: hypothetical protein PLU24_00535 [Candidatus Omnitrophota bacterium]|nr:hypothetical protein [Candidatus Omnitrophota bacterium]
MKNKEIFLKDACKSRRPGEYIQWFEAKLHDTRYEYDAMLQKREFGFKWFYSELFPLYRLLQQKSSEWKDYHFLPIDGCQNFDVEVQINEKERHYIEISDSIMTQQEYKRRLYYVVHGKEFIEDDRELAIKKKTHQCIKDRIMKRINKKMDVIERPKNTSLLIQINDIEAFRYDSDLSKIEMNEFLDSLRENVFNRYCALYLVGISGKSFYEKKR